MKTFTLLAAAVLFATGLHAQTTPVKKTTTTTKTTVRKTTPAPTSTLRTADTAPAPAPNYAPAPRATAAPAPRPAAPARAAAPRPATVAQPSARQSSSLGIQFGIVGGLSLANLVVSGGGQSLTSPMRLGFHGGLLADIPLGEHLSIQPGLRYIIKGSKAADDKSFGDLALGYVELPVTLFYVLPMGNNKFRIGAGGYAAYGLTVSTTNGSASSTAKFGSGVNDANPLDFGAQAAIQFQAGSILIGANYAYGFGNLINQPPSGLSLTNRTIGISLGFMFGGR